MNMHPLLKRALARWKPQRDFLPNDACLTQAPSPQATIDLIDGWITAFPESTGIKTGGYAKLFEDARVAWGLGQCGGARDASILELGPLEGAHTYLLDRAGAKSIVAIEGLKRSYLKCLITKEVLGIHSANFLLGNFIPWLENDRRKFDLVWASGVLYHMTEPTHLLRLIAARTGKVFLWTHYYPDDFAPAPPYRAPLAGVRDVEFNGRLIRHFDRSYMGAMDTAAFCGGVYSGASWLRRGDILAVLADLGLSRIEIAFDQPDAETPSFAVVATRG